jgi:8-oxo-dGTP pyrophosphatase MutT (NUDIX family)
MIEERSAGAVVVLTIGEEPLFLLLHYPTGHWDFPKGKIEDGELEIETAKREVLEETGINSLEIVPGFRHEVEYNYQRIKQTIHKQVIYFLAKTTNKSVTISDEHQGHVWLPYEKAQTKLTFANSRGVLKAAWSVLSSSR